MGPAFDDVETVSSKSEGQIIIRLHRPSPFLLEALEVPVPKPGTSLVGTGPFKVDNPESPTEMRRWTLRVVPWIVVGVATYAFVIFGADYGNGTVRWLAFLAPLVGLPIAAAQGWLRRRRRPSD